MTLGSEIIVFNDWVRKSIVEKLAYRVDLFNQASNGGLVLTSSKVAGDYRDATHWALNSGLVRRRDAYGSDPIAQTQMSMLQDTAVKVAAGTKEVLFTPSDMKWIAQDPKVAAAAMAETMSQQMLADMVASAIGPLIAAIGTQASNVNDVTAETAPDNEVSLVYLNNTRYLLGDRMDSIRCWIMHSETMRTLHNKAIVTNNLFTFGTVNIRSDQAGNTFIISDNPLLINSGSPNTYNILGLTPGAAVVEEQGDFLSFLVESTGNENLQRTFQAEWSYMCGIKGFRWNKAGGGASPDDTELTTGTNWTRYATSHKDLGGVLGIVDASA